MSVGMLRPRAGAVLFTTACLATAVSAQNVKRAERIPGPVKDAGIYHVSTGTWTRTTADTIHLGPKVLSNLANTGYFGLHNDNEIWWHTGRVPGTGDAGLPNAKSDCYSVNGIQIGYCSSQGGAGTDILIACYEQLASCIDPSLFMTISAVVVAGLPGSSATGAAACWIVTLDLQGTSFTVNVGADGGDGFDSMLDLDSGGGAFSMVSTAGGQAGPILNGDPRNFPYASGTYYQSSTATLTTGLGIQDQFYLLDTTGVLANGCYWFGGYVNGAPHSTPWIVLFGDNLSGPDVCIKVCQSNPSSVGAGAHMSVEAAGGGVYRLVAEPVPNQPGIFFHAPNSIRVPFGNGFLCAGGGLVRLLPPVVATGNRAVRDTDVSGLSGIRYFQFWFRDPAGGGASYNTSNAICCDFGS